jgi:hypothetical protein
MEMYQPQSLPPYMRGLVKIHKTENLVRPIVNWNNAPAYKLADVMTHKLTQFNINYILQLIQNLEEISIAPNKRLISPHRNFFSLSNTIMFIQNDDDDDNNNNNGDDDDDNNNNNKEVHTNNRVVPKHRLCLNLVCPEQHHRLN